MWRIDIKWKYMFMFPLKILARKELTPTSFQLMPTEIMAGLPFLTFSVSKLYMICIIACKKYKSVGVSCDICIIIVIHVIMILWCLSLIVAVLSVINAFPWHAWPLYPYSSRTKRINWPISKQNKATRTLMILPIYCTKPKGQLGNWL